MSGTDKKPGEHLDIHSQVILIIDDTPINLDIMVKFLTNHGFQVIIAQSGEKGLMLAQQAHPDLILLDVLMPGIDGFETCRQLKATESTKEIPVIFMTSLVETEKKVVGFEVGGVDYITKPFQAQEVLVRIKTHLDIRAMQKQLEAQNAQLQQEIIERKRLEEELRKHQEQLEVAMKELEAFSYSVSHDLRAPLRGIGGFSQALLEDYAGQLDTQGQDYLRRVRAASQRMERLIDDMLRLARMTRSEIRRTTVDLSALAQSIAGELRQTQPQRQVEFIIAPGLMVKADENLMRIVLANLLGNAWKFSSKHPTARIELGATQGEGETIYFVRDDGTGFDMTYAGKLFGVFQRMHSEAEFEGSGVGLATVQRIIHRHGGRVWAESALEQGATFYFTLPT